MDVAPLPEHAARAAVMLADWNERLLALAAALRVDRPDAAVWLYDAHRLFLRVLADPAAATPQTARLRNTTDLCAFYRSE